MSSSSSTSLTKFSSGSTILTANIANSMYGGLYGSSEASSLAVDDPRVIGHVHDGLHIDGHSQKINLVDHVTGQITNPNIADNTINYAKIAKYSNKAQAIPEYETIGGTNYYYLDLTYIRDEFSESILFERKDPAKLLISTKNLDYKPIYADSLVIGSSSMDNLSLGTEGRHRMFFDVPKAAFRAGTADGGEWDDVNRAKYSAGFGYNTVSNAEASFAAGYQNYIDSTAKNSTVFGKNNKAYKENCFVLGLGAQSKSIDGSLTHSNGSFSENGDSQRESFILRKQILAGPAYTKVSLGSIAGLNFGLDDFSTYSVKADVIMKQFNTGDTSVFSITTVILGVAGVLTIPGGATTVTTIYSNMLSTSVEPKLVSVGPGYELHFEVTDTNVVTQNVRWIASVDILKLKYEL